jgi:hypothetical protein
MTVPNLRKNHDLCGIFYQKNKANENANQKSAWYESKIGR